MSAPHGRAVYNFGHVELSTLNRNRIFLGILVFSLLAFLPACSALPAPTNTALSSPSASPTRAVTPTPSVTATYPPTPDRAPTVVALATLFAEQAVATIIPELNELGYTRDLGKIVWHQQEELQMMATGGSKLLYYPLDPELVLGDFILGFDVTWNSSSGYAGCGIIFRAENFEGGEQAAFETLRLSGAPVWYMLLFRQYESNAFVSGYLSSAIDQNPYATNHYVIAGKGLSITAYANGHRLGAGTLSDQRTRGQFGIFVSQDTGTTICTFSNGWIMDTSPAE